LGFISEIDEMMFNALVGQTSKDDISNTKIVTTSNCAPFLVNVCSLPIPPAGLLFVISMVAVQMNLALYSPVGKYALAVAYDCLCQAEGPDCLAAQLLGGDRT